MAQKKQDQKDLDCVVFGATGFTGRFIIDDLVKAKESASLRIAVAGRSAARLQTLREEVLGANSSNGSNLSDRLSIIVADTSDEASMAEMAKRARLVINATGPYRFHGRSVVKACVENSANYIDISGEPEFLEATELEFHEAAKEKGLVVVGACGWDSVPSDLGVFLTTQAFLSEYPGGKVETVDGYLELSAPKGTSAHVTTLECAVYGLQASSRKALANIRRQIKAKFGYPDPPSGRKVPLTLGAWHRAPDFRQYFALPFPGADVSVVRRSQRYFRSLSRPAVGYSMYFLVGLMTFMKLIMFGLICKVMITFPLGRKLLLRYPEVFTAGAFSKAGPSEEQRRVTHGAIHFVAEGVVQEGNPPVEVRKKLKARYEFPDPGYVATAALANSCALSVLFDRTSDSPSGVLTPAGALSGTQLRNRLERSGICFKVESVR